MKKQYVIKKSYGNNSQILQYVNGKYEAETIIADYKIHGYISALEDMGYARAYYEKEFLIRIKNLEEELRAEKEWYLNTQNCFLNLSADEAKKYEELTDFDENDY